MEDVLHKIKVNLYENFLTDNPNDYSAKVISERSLSVKEICQTLDLPKACISLK